MELCLSNTQAIPRSPPSPKLLDQLLSQNKLQGAGRVDNTSHCSLRHTSKLIPPHLIFCPFLNPATGKSWVSIISTSALALSFPCSPSIPLICCPGPAFHVALKPPAFASESLQEPNATSFGRVVEECPRNKESTGLHHSCTHHSSDKAKAPIDNSTGRASFPWHTSKRTRPGPAPPDYLDQYLTASTLGYTTTHCHPRQNRRDKESPPRNNRPFLSLSIYSLLHQSPRLLHRHTLSMV